MSEFYFEIDKMEGHDFEYFCAEVLRKNGFSHVVVTRGSGDFGIDIIAKRNGETFAVQCKRFSGNVGNKAVQAALSGKVYYNCDRAVVLTNSFFTGQAKETARRTGVELWDRNTLDAMVKAAYPKNATYKLPIKKHNVHSRHRSNKRIVCLPKLAVLAVFALSLVTMNNTKLKTETTDEKDNMISVVNLDEGESLENNANVTTVIKNGVCYKKIKDHYEVYALSDHNQQSITIETEIGGKPVTAIGERAFANENITSVKMPSGITVIKKQAFCACKELRMINIPDGITTIGEDAFLLCESLNSIVLPESVTQIEYGSFGSSGIQSINLENVSEIGAGAFLDSKIESITFSQNLGEIREYTFRNCNNIREITLPEGIETIGKECFAYCENMTAVTLPETLTSIGICCFNGCTSLKEIRIPSKITELNDSQMFNFCSDLQVIYIPSTCKIPEGNDPFTGCSARIVFY